MIHQVYRLPPNTLKTEEERRERRRFISIRHNRKVKKEVLGHYSGGIPQCDCCGELYLEFLSIDHIDGGGAQHRKEAGIGGGYSLYSWLYKQGYPEGFRVLCHNCNQAIGQFGYCPHERHG